MGSAISMEPRAGRSAGRVLPGPSGRTTGSQRATGGALQVSEGERLARLEGKTEAYDKMFVKMSNSLDAINQSLQKLIALEQQHQALDQRHIQLRDDFSSSAKHQGDRLGKIEDRLQTAERFTTLNTHGRDMWEGIIKPLIASVVSGSLIAVSVYLFLQNHASI